MRMAKRPLSLYVPIGVVQDRHANCSTYGKEMSNWYPTQLFLDRRNERDKKMTQI